MSMTRADYLLYGAISTALRGEQLPHAKLTTADVVAIRRNVRGMTAKQLAAQYGVHKRTIDAVRERRNWRHVDA
jgi:acetyl-CoA acetyltransferase